MHVELCETAFFFRTKRRNKTSTLDSALLKLVLRLTKMGRKTEAVHFQFRISMTAGRQEINVESWSLVGRKALVRVSRNTVFGEFIKQIGHIFCLGREHRVSQMQLCKTRTLIVLNPGLMCANLNYLFGSKDFRQYHL